MSIPGYVKKVLKMFKHQTPSNPQNHPHPHILPKYGAQVQYSELEDTMPKISKDRKRFIQEVMVTFLFYARAIYTTMLMAQSAIASEKPNPTEPMMKNCK